MYPHEVYYGQLNLQVLDGSEGRHLKKCKFYSDGLLEFVTQDSITDELEITIS